MKKVFKFALLCIMLLLTLAGCDTETVSTLPEDPIPEDSMTEVYTEEYPNLLISPEVQVNNLVKLCKVWGFTKYTHLVFLRGEMCWDDELLNLIPIVLSTAEANINTALYDWFMSLGECGHGISVDIALADMRVMSNTNWINEDFLGEPLTAALSRFNGSAMIGLNTAPVFFDATGISVFTNKDYHFDMDFSDYRYRLLGLFRLWNAIEYYFPHRYIMDKDWSMLLAEFIPKMLEGSDRFSYERTLAALVSNLHDPAASLMRMRDPVPIVHRIINELFGTFAPAALFLEVEGQLIVVALLGDGSAENQLMPGDIVLSLNNVCIDEVIADMLQFVSHPNDESAFGFLLRKYLHLPLRQMSNTTPMEIVVLRDGEELNLKIEDLFDIHDLYLIEVEGFDMTIRQSHELLDSNIGLINTGLFEYSPTVLEIMMDFADTDGLIIDLRGRFVDGGLWELERWLLDQSASFMYRSFPLKQMPGVFVPGVPSHSMAMGLRYDRNVIILMNYLTEGFGEHMVMMLRNGPNVTVLGSNSIGATSWSTVLPLPGA